MACRYAVVSVISFFIYIIRYYIQLPQLEKTLFKNAEPKIESLSADLKTQEMLFQKPQRVSMGQCALPENRNHFLGNHVSPAAFTCGINQ